MPDHYSNLEQAQHYLMLWAVENNHDPVEAVQMLNDYASVTDRLQFADLAQMMREMPEPATPTVGAMTDGACLFYRGAMHSVYGKPSSGKTMFMQHVVANEIKAGHNVIWIDTEEFDERSMAIRLNALMVDPDLVEKHLQVAILGRPLSTDNRDMIKTMIANDDVHLVVLDSFGELLANHGRDENKDDAVSWTFDLLEPWAIAGAAVVVIDHPSHSTMWRPAGSKRKMARPWVLYALNADCHDEDEERARGFSRRHSGYANIFCVKDRGGTYDKYTRVAKLIVEPMDPCISLKLEHVTGDDLDDVVTTASMVVAFEQQLEQIVREAEVIPQTSQTVKNNLHLETKIAAEKLLTEARDRQLIAWSKQHEGYIPITRL